MSSAPIVNALSHSGMFERTYFFAEFVLVERIIYKLKDSRISLVVTKSRLRLIALSRFIIKIFS